MLIDRKNHFFIQQLEKNVYFCMLLETEKSNKL